jgi:hypothetical protein
MRIAQSCNQLVAHQSHQFSQYIPAVTKRLFPIPYVQELYSCCYAMRCECREEKRVGGAKREEAEKKRKADPIGGIQ